MEENKISIRDALVEEAPILAEFMRLQGKEAEDKDVDADLVLKGATNLFAKPKYAKYYVAVMQEEIVGMIMIHHEMSP